MGFLVDLQRSINVIKGEFEEFYTIQYEWPNLNMERPKEDNFYVEIELMSNRVPTWTDHELSWKAKDKF